MNFCRKRLGGGLYLLPKFRCGTYVFKYSKHKFLKTQNNISTVILIAENWCDPRHLHLQDTYCSDMPKSVFLLMMYFNHFDIFYFWLVLIDCLVISCFTSTQTIVGINLGSKLKVCVCWGVGRKVGNPHPYPVLTPVVGEGCKARLLCLLSGETYLSCCDRASVFALFSRFHDKQLVLYTILTMKFIKLTKG